MSKNKMNTETPIYTDKEIQYDEITSKGIIEMKVMIGNMVMRQTSTSISHVNKSPEEISQIIYRTSKIQEVVDLYCIWWSYMLVQETIHQYENSKILKGIKKDFGIDFDVRRWISDYDYYMKIFNENRKIHSFIFGYLEYRSIPFIDELKDWVNHRYIPYMCGDLDKEDVIPKDGDLMSEGFESWCHYMEGHTKKDVEMVLKNLKERWSNSTTKYKTTPLERSLKNFNQDKLFGKGVN